MPWELEVVDVTGGPGPGDRPSTRGRPNGWPRASTSPRASRSSPTILYRTGDRAWWFWCGHHIVADAASGAMAAMRLADRYTALVDGTPPPARIPPGSLDPAGRRRPRLRGVARRPSATPPGGSAARPTPPEPVRLSRTDAVPGTAGAAQPSTPRRRARRPAPGRLHVGRPPAVSGRDRGGGRLRPPAHGGHRPRARAAGDRPVRAGDAHAAGDARQRRAAAPGGAARRPSPATSSTPSAASLQKAALRQRHRGEDLARDLGVAGGVLGLIGPAVNYMGFDLRLRFGDAVGLAAHRSAPARSTTSPSRVYDRADRPLRFDVEAQRRSLHGRRGRRPPRRFVRVLAAFVDTSASRRRRPADRHHRPPARRRARRPSLGAGRRRTAPRARRTIAAGFERQVDRTPDAVAVIDGEDRAHLRRPRPVGQPARRRASGPGRRARRRGGARAAPHRRGRGAVLAVQKAGAAAPARSTPTSPPTGSRRSWPTPRPPSWCPRRPRRRPAAGRRGDVLRARRPERGRGRSGARTTPRVASGTTPARRRLRHLHVRVDRSTEGRRRHPRGHHVAGAAPRSRGSASDRRAGCSSSRRRRSTSPCSSCAWRCTPGRRS